MTQRKEQRESVLLRAIQDVISRGLADPRIRGLITVTGIKLSDDGKNATVMISVMPDDRQDLTMHGLRAASKRIRKDAMSKIRLRDMPKLEFVTDASIKEQGELLAAINKAAAATPPAPDSATENDDELSSSPTESEPTATSDATNFDATPPENPAVERPAQ